MLAHRYKHVLERLHYRVEFIVVSMERKSYDDLPVALRLREELVQVAAMAVAWIDAIDHTPSQIPLTRNPSNEEELATRVDEAKGQVHSDG